MSNNLGRVDIRAIRCDEYCVDEEYSEQSFVERMTYAAFKKMCSQLELQFQLQAVWRDDHNFELLLPNKIKFVGHFLSDAEYLALKVVGCNHLHPCIAGILTNIESYFGVEFDA